MKRICIIAAKRTVQGRLMGGLAKRSAVELAVLQSGGSVETVCIFVSVPLAGSKSKAVIVESSSLIT